MEVALTATGVDIAESSGHDWVFLIVRGSLDTKLNAMLQWTQAVTGCIRDRSTAPVNDLSVLIMIPSINKPEPVSPIRVKAPLGSQVGHRIE